MTDLDKILLTSVLTIFGGVMIHMISQVFIKAFLEPCTEFKKARADIITYLHFYSNMFDSKLTGKDNEEYRQKYYNAQDDIRLAMAKSRASYCSISPQWLALFLTITPRYETFEKIGTNLLSLSFLGSFKVGDKDPFSGSNLAKDTLKLLKVKGHRIE